MSSKQTILVVDDEQTMREWLANPPWQARYEVRTARDGAEALAALAGRRRTSS